MLQPHRKVSCLTSFYTKKSGKWLLFLLILRSESLFSGSYNILNYYYTLQLWTFHYKKIRRAITLCGRSVLWFKFQCRPWTSPWWSYPCTPSWNPQLAEQPIFKPPDFQWRAIVNSFPPWPLKENCGANCRKNEQEKICHFTARQEIGTKYCFYTLWVSVFVKSRDEVHDIQDRCLV